MLVCHMSQLQHFWKTLNVPESISGQSRLQSNGYQQKKEDVVLWSEAGDAQNKPSKELGQNWTEMKI